MYKEIKLDGIDIGMVANATTPLRYKQVFNKNLFANFKANLPADEATELAGELGYIMMAQAAKLDFATMNHETYWAWLEGLSPLAIAVASSDILALYTSNTQTASNPKKR